MDDLFTPPIASQIYTTGDGNGNFQTSSALSAGLDVNGEVRRIIYLQDKNSSFS